MAQLGKPYVWAAAGPDAFDCSGLVVYAFAAFGVSLPHSTYALWNMGVYFSRDQLQPGDLVFFDALGPMGIYIGGGQFIHAPHTGDVVKISSMNAPPGTPLTTSERGASCKPSGETPGRTDPYPRTNLRRATTTGLGRCATHVSRPRQADGDAGRARISSC
jgi:hypothetical protein